MKVFVVMDHGMYDGEGPFCSYSIFSTYEKAKEFFDNYVKNVKETDESNGYDMVEEEKDYYAAWADGYYSSDHIVVELEEAEVDKNAKKEK